MISTACIGGASYPSGASVFLVPEVSSAVYANWERASFVRQLRVRLASVIVLLLHPHHVIFFIIRCAPFMNIRPIAI